MLDIIIQLAGEYVSQYARDFISKYAGPNWVTHYNAGQGNTVTWSGGSFGNGDFTACCTTGVAYMFQMALGINIYDLGFSCNSETGIGQMTSEEYSGNWIRITNSSDLQPGDIVMRIGHTEMYIGGEENANWGSGINTNGDFDLNCAGKISKGPRLGTDFNYAFRLASDVPVDPSGKVTGTGVAAGKSIDYSNFFFNGIPDGKYSLATRKNVFEIIIDALKALLNWLVGLITYILRGVIISFMSIFDRLLNNSISSLKDNVSKSLQQSGVTATSADDPLSENRSITIEELVFNEIDLFDINIFRVD